MNRLRLYTAAVSRKPAVFGVAAIPILILFSYLYWNRCRLSGSWQYNAEEFLLCGFGLYYF
jgi:hypothetical protein